MAKGLIPKILLTITATSIILVSSLAIATPNTQVAIIKKPMKAKTSLLVVLSAKSGAIKKSADSYHLTLNNVTPRVLWFTDRPNRKAGFISINKFITQWWPKAFKKSAPNAAEVHASMSAQVNGRMQPLAIELKNPKLSNGNLSYDIMVLPGDTIKAGTLKTPVLFIDDFFGCTNSGPQSCECYGTCGYAPE